VRGPTVADRNENLVAERVNRTAMTWLHQYDETFEPPQQNVLGVRVVAGLDEAKVAAISERYARSQAARRATT